MGKGAGAQVAGEMGQRERECVCKELGDVELRDGWNWEGGR